MKKILLIQAHPSGDSLCHAMADAFEAGVRATPNELRHTILGFCGISTSRISEFAPVYRASAAQRARWLEQTRRLGRAAG